MSSSPIQLFSSFSYIRPQTCIFRVCVVRVRFLLVACLCKMEKYRPTGFFKFQSRVVSSLHTLISYYLICMHSHGGPDQRFRLISGALSMITCLTLETFIHVVQHSFMPTPTMRLLKKSLDVHGWLEDVFSKQHSCTSIPRQFIFSENDNVGGAVDGVKAMVPCSE